MKIIIRSFLFLIPLLCSSRADRQGKRFSLFNIIRFPNVECATSTGRNGTCFKMSECENALSGEQAGSCAEGFGTCCLLERTCGQHATRNITYFTSPGYPAPFSGPSSCVLRVARHQSICQLRLDMEHFEIHGPTDGACDTDYFEVNNTLGLPTLCGDNTGQHMYVDVEDIEGPLHFSMTTGLAERNRRWSIKITQIPCGSKYISPQGCLQCYTDLHGRIMSFNRNQMHNNTRGYLNNLDYAICFRRQPGMCSIEFTPNQSASFSLERKENSTIPCSSDYLLFPGVGRVCGNIFDEPIRVTTSGPTTVYFKSDNATAEDGFDLQFNQALCHLPF